MADIVPNPDDAPTESFLDRLKKLLGHDTKPVAPVVPTPTSPETHYLKALALLRQIDFKKLGPVVFTVPVVLFFAISGFIAWLGLLVGFFIRIVKAVLWRRHD
jgi:hypothetical protein